jgi:plasmid stabilization system protein ParE
VPENDPAAAVHMAEAFLEALDDLEQSKLVGTPERRAKVAALRRKTAELCRKAYETRAREDLVAPLAAPMSGDEVILALEAKARHLRALEQAGRRLADPEMFDRMRVELMETIRRAKHGVDVSGAGLEDVDLIRLIEILSGPEAAILLRPKL